MEASDLNLRVLRESLELSLRHYEKKTGMTFRDFPDLSLTPEKPNSARTIIPVSFEGSNIGELYAIVFLKGDGTGDSRTYKPADIIIPSELYHFEKVERVIPRAKTGIIYEFCFPFFFSVNAERKIAMFASSLDELGIEDGRISPLLKIGLSNPDYSRALDDSLRVQPQIYMTVGTSMEGKRIGDPHSIYYSKEVEDAIQVVGFYGISDPDSSILKNCKNWMIPP